MKRAHLFSLTLAALLSLTACGKSAQPIAEAAPKTRTVLNTLTVETFAGDVTIASKTEYLYDDQGLMTEIVAYTNGEETSRTAVENNEYGEPIRQTAISGGVTTVTESERTYDENGTLLNTVDTVTRDGNVTDIREYSYNADGKPLHAVFTSLGENAYTTSNTYEYDDSGRQTAVLQESNVYTARTETEYDESGRALRTVSTNADGQVTSYSEFTYAEDGTVTQAAYSADGTPMGCTLTTQDAQGNPLTVETYTGDTLMMRMTYTYITVPAFR